MSSSLNPVGVLEYKVSTNSDNDQVFGPSGISLTSVPEFLIPSENFTSARLEGHAEREEEVTETSKNSSTNVNREILPGDKDKIIKLYHDMGHFGVKLTYKRLRHHGFNWPNIQGDLEQIVGRCGASLRHTVQPTIKHALTSIVAAKPLDHIALDLVTPIPVDNMGCDTLFVLVDIAMRYVWMKALKGKNMNLVANAFWDLFSVFGAPKVIQSDNGTEYVNSMFKKLTDIHESLHRTITVGNSRANGAVENANKTAEAYLKKLVNGDFSQWSVYVPVVQIAMNSRISSRTRISPHFLMFGRSMNLFGQTAVTSNKFEESDWVDRWRIMNDVLLFKAGDYVMLRNVKISKLDDNYVGPFVIKGTSRHGQAYVLKDMTGKVLERKEVPDHLKRINTPDTNQLLEPLNYVKKIVGHRMLPDHSHEYGEDSTLPNDWLKPEHFDGINLINAYWRTARPKKSKAVKKTSSKAEAQDNQELGGGILCLPLT